MKQETVLEVKIYKPIFIRVKGLPKLSMGYPLLFKKEKHWALLVNLVVENP